MSPKYLVTSCGDWSLRLSLAVVSVLLSQGHQGGTRGWCRALVVRWHRAVGRQGPLGAPLEPIASPIARRAPHAKKGMPSPVCTTGRRIDRQSRT